jgi:hypothetical protein
VSLIKSLDVPLINVAIRDVFESSRSSLRPMQPNPWLTIRDKIKLSRIAADLDDDLVPTWMMTWRLREQ